LREIKQEEFTEVVGLIALGNEVQLKDSLTEKEVIDSVALVKSEVDSLDISKELNDKPSGRRVYGLFIRLLASPDLSAIKFGPTQWGSNFGLVGEYAFSVRLSLSTGIIRAKKNYESYQEEAYGANAQTSGGQLQHFRCTTQLYLLFSLATETLTVCNSGCIVLFDAPRRLCLYHQIKLRRPCVSVSQAIRRKQRMV
jgi:hypothetical protein